MKEKDHNELKIIYQVWFCPISWWTLSILTFEHQQESQASNMMLALGDGQNPFHKLKADFQN